MNFGDLASKYGWRQALPHHAENAPQVERSC